MLNVFFSQPDPVTMGIYTASLLEGETFLVTSVLSFMTPINSTNSNKAIMCAVDDSATSCPFSIEGMSDE